MARFNFEIYGTLNLPGPNNENEREDAKKYLNDMIVRAREFGYGNGNHEIIEQVRIYVTEEID